MQHLLLLMTLLYTFDRILFLKVIPNLVLAFSSFLLYYESAFLFSLTISKLCYSFMLLWCFKGITSLVCILQWGWGISSDLLTLMNDFILWSFVCDWLFVFWNYGWCRGKVFSAVVDNFLVNCMNSKGFSWLELLIGRLYSCLKACFNCSCWWFDLLALVWRFSYSYSILKNP